MRFIQWLRLCKANLKSWLTKVLVLLAKGLVLLRNEIYDLSILSGASMFGSACHTTVQSIWFDVDHNYYVFVVAMLLMLTGRLCKRFF
ncbi:hypothetical protein C9I99_20990 [Photobacterium lutimaris]|uniref:Uncharacterized protein n=1 Tax=Photobacterium lutimaris TaxID=388278 RepID=A0A2T3ITH3_9GAMM|nr:hypothetical protein C9I99_20990 [Photobacterium lutimaris]TDR72698.1 hypothetical protein DFP78_113174 [Photobacterium lutimaris]